MYIDCVFSAIGCEKGGVVGSCKRNAGGGVVFKIRYSLVGGEFMNRTVVYRMHGFHVCNYPVEINFYVCHGIAPFSSQRLYLIFKLFYVNQPC